MIAPFLLRSYPEVPVDRAQVLRYARCREEDGGIGALLDACVREAKGVFAGKVGYRMLPVKTDGAICDFSLFSLPSRDLARALDGCGRAVLFAATVGVGIDRLIARYSRLSPAKALLFQALGAQQVEAVCDAFCADLERETGAPLRQRFSPGYGDLALEVQREVFTILDGKRIGVSLSESLLMTPSKSVTAFVGIPGNG